MRLRFLLVCLFCFSGLAQAAEPVTMDVSSPFALTTKPLSVVTKFGRWFPVAVTLANSGDPLSGEVSLRFLARDNGGGQGPATMMPVANVDLPTNSRKRVWLYARRDGDQWEAARVTFRARGAKTLNAEFDLRSLDIGKRIISTVSEAGIPYKWLEGFTARGLESVTTERDVPVAANSMRPLQSVAAGREWVPDRWVGLESADAVILHDFPHASLSPAQIESLRGYVACGGTLIVAGGANWQRLASSPLADLWPVSPVSSGAATVSETTELVRRWVEDPRDGADRLGGAPILLARGSMKAGTQLLAGSAAAPLAALRPTGAGRVIWLSFDPSQPPFIGWRGQESLWLELTQRMTEPVRFEGVDAGRRMMAASYDPNTGADTVPQGQTGAVLQVIRKMPQLQMPSTSVIAWFLAAYVFLLVPVNYFVLRAFDKREWAWFTVPLIAVAFSIASYQAARRIKGVDLLRRHVSVIQGDHGLARADSMLWIRSPRRAYFSVSSPNATMALSNYQTYGDNDHTQETRLRIDELTRSLRAEDISVPMWTEAQFTGEGTLDLKKGLTVESTPAGLALRNGTPLPIYNGLVVNGAKLWRCEELLKAGGSSPLRPVVGVSAGENLSARVQNAGRVTKFFEAASGLEVSDKTLAELARAVLDQALPREQAGPLFIGWSRDAVSPLTLEGESPVTQNVSLFLLRLPVSAAFSIKSPQTSVTMQRTNRSLVAPKLADASPALAVYETEAPAAAFELSVEVKKLYDDTSSNGFAMPAPPASDPRRKADRKSPALEVSLFDFKASRWEKAGGRIVKTDENDTVLYRALVSPAGRFTRQPDGIVRIRVRTQRSTFKVKAPVLTTRG